MLKLDKHQERKREQNEQQQKKQKNKKYYLHNRNQYVEGIDIDVITHWHVRSI